MKKNKRFQLNIGFIMIINYKATIQTELIKCMLTVMQMWYRMILNNILIIIKLDWTENVFNNRKNAEYKTTNKKKS